jgi:hypothetical protein
LPPSGDRSKAVMMTVIVRPPPWRKSSAAGLASCQGSLNEIEDDPLTLK